MVSKYARISEEQILQILNRHQKSIELAWSRVNWKVQSKPSRTLAKRKNWFNEKYQQVIDEKNAANKQCRDLRRTAEDICKKKKRKFLDNPLSVRTCYFYKREFGPTFFSCFYENIYLLFPTYHQIALGLSEIRKHINNEIYMYIH